MREADLARKSGYLHPDIRGLIDYILDALKDNGWEDWNIAQYIHMIKVAIRNNLGWFPYSGPSYIVRSKQDTYYTTDRQSGVHVELETIKNETIDIRFPADMMLVSDKGIVSISIKDLLVRSALYLSYYAAYHEVQGVLGHSSMPLILRNLDNTMDDNIIFGYLRWAGSDKYDEIIRTCQEKQHPELLMRILRIIEERGFRYEQQLRI